MSLRGDEEYYVRHPTRAPGVQMIAFERSLKTIFKAETGSDEAIERFCLDRLFPLVLFKDDGNQDAHETISAGLIRDTLDVIFPETRQEENDDGYNPTDIVLRACERERRDFERKLKQRSSIEWALDVAIRLNVIED